MKTIILAGGMGTRLAEETDLRPKPLIEIGGRPILWHIMKIFSHFGHNEFCIALGYRGEMIKKYFIDYARLASNCTVRTRTGDVLRQQVCEDDWTVHLVDTGLETQTGGRIKRLQPYIGGETFFMTYGDGVANIDLRALVAFHRRHGKLATVTAVRPPARFGELVFDGDDVVFFTEKPQTGEGWINGGFFVLEPEVFDYIEGDHTSWEKEPLERLASEGQLVGYRHHDFWQCMDTLRDLRRLEGLWRDQKAPWKIWSDGDTPSPHATPAKSPPASSASGELVAAKPR